MNSQPCFLENLPNEIIDEILQYLPRKALLNLSATSWRWNKASAPLLFRHIRFQIYDPPTLKKDVKKWDVILSRHDNIQHVRQISVIGAMLKHVYYGASNPKVPRKPQDRFPEDKDDDLSEHISPYRPIYMSHRGHFEEQCYQGYQKDQREAWLPFAEFLLRLPRLTDLVYNCLTHFPTGVLQALHSRSGPEKCRLHISTFDLRTLGLYAHGGPFVDREARVHPDELQLLTSPCLSSARLCVGSTNITDVAVAHVLMSGCGSRLKHLHVHCIWPISDQVWQPMTHDNTPYWRSIFPRLAPREVPGYSEMPQPISFNPAQPLARLDTLCLSGLLIGEEAIEQWALCVDFTRLRRFGFHGDMSFDCLRTLVTRARDPKSGRGGRGWFRSLRSLDLTITGGLTDQNDTFEGDEIVRKFLSLLPPLEHLTVDGYGGEGTFLQIVQSHGPTLRKLHLQTWYEPWSYAPEELSYMADRCPRLEDFRVYTMRIRNSEELDGYRALARFPSLRRLELVLNCMADTSEISMQQLERPRGQLGSNLEPWQVEQLRNSLLNFASDRAFARAVWSFINEERRKNSLIPLEKLVVGPDTARASWGGYSDTFGVWIEWIGRHWECTRADQTTWDGSRRMKRAARYGGGVVVREKRDPTMDRRASQMQQICTADGVDIWRSVWPAKDPKRQWHDEWHSFPLFMEPRLLPPLQS
ncbi:hypothetical protein VTJ04DRAFT_2218 [Mycothermus thermophilus]|uniref:uncharacterized protein n=1 Tax=Humicola insolens TaxID=85995 RepID=UPI003741E974